MEPSILVAIIPAMKIALVTKRTDPSRGGAERYTVDLATALMREGHKVFILAASVRGVPKGVTPVRLSARGFTGIGRQKRFLDSLGSHLRSNRYDIVHAMLPVRRCDVYHPHAGMMRANVASDSLWTRLTNPRRGYNARVEGDLLEGDRPPMVLCLSEYVKSAVKRVYDLPDARLPILFNAVNLDRFDPAKHLELRDSTRHQFGFSSDDVVGLFLGHDFERKGLREAILALQRSSSSGEERLRLLVVGRPRGAEFQALAQDERIRDRIVFAGHVDDSRPVYHAADFLVLPTKHDPCSLVVLEGLAMGVPVISTVFNGACEIMTSGTHGFVLDNPTDVASLASAMEAMTDDSRRRGMAAAALALRPALAYQRHLDTLLSIYERVRKPSA
jgi:UDP-glucose:(heptosyl)LPS alpha-1,3-glucosyltransferase